MNQWSCKSPEIICSQQAYENFFKNRTYGYGQGSRKPENSQSGQKIRIPDRFQTPKNANNLVQQVCALNPIFSPTNQFSWINDV